MQEMDNLDNLNTPESCPKQFHGKKDPKEMVLSVLDYLEIFVTAIAIVILLFSFVFRICNVSGPSMEQTLYQDDTLIISNLFYEPSYGDIVVFHQTGYIYNEPIVKRVIALEGETVNIDFNTWTVSVTDTYGNTRTLSEEYMYLDTGYARLFSDYSFPYTVPDGHIFVLGDNRNNSSDSRSATIGPVDTRRILGKVIFRLAPLDKIGAVD